MNRVGLMTAIRTWLLTDTGSGGLFNVASPLITGLYFNLGPSNLTNAFPFVVMFVLSAPQDDGLTMDIIEYTVRFSIFAEQNKQAYVGPERAAAIMVRLYGDASTRADLTPTYGLHRKQLTLVGGWDVTQIVRVNEDSASDEDFIREFQDYKCFVSRHA